MRPRYLMLAALVVAAGACADRAEPVGVQPEMEPREAGADAALFAAARQASPLDGSSGLTIGILDEGRTDGSATVVFWNGTDYRGMRFHREGAEWMPAGEVQVSAVSDVSQGQGEWEVQASQDPLGEARGASGTVLYTYPFPPLQSGSYWHTNPTPFSGDGARQAVWTRTNPAIHEVNGTQWEVAFNQWHFCRVWSNGSNTCSADRNTTTSTTHFSGWSTYGSHTVTLYYNVAATTVPPLGVWISGPYSISAKSTYTYTTSVSGGGTGTLSYQWQERFCDTEGVCDAWAEMYVTSSSVNRVIGPDCRGSGLAKYELRVTATRSNGMQGTDEHTTHLCESSIELN